MIKSFFIHIFQSYNFGIHGNALFVGQRLQWKRSEVKHLISVFHGHYACFIMTSVQLLYIITAILHH